MKIYHLSHTDLDGYAAQFVTKHFFNNAVFLNSNYGKEIDEKFSSILEMIDKNKDEKSLVLITDLNLSLTQCEKFQNDLKDRNSKIFLLDHHQSGLECAKKYPWYFMDSSRCATKITYDFFSSMFNYQNAKMSKFVDVVNCVDIWLSDRVEFELGKVLLGMVSSAKEINRVMFESSNSEYIFFLLSEIFEFLDLQDAHIKLDDSLHGIKKKFFKMQNNDTLGNLVANYVVFLLNQNKEKLKISYRGKVGVLTYNIGNVSVTGNEFLLANKDIDFFLDITSKKSMSFRANGNADVSQIAKELVGGGGHINASGGMFASFKDGYTYESIKSQIVALLERKEEEILKQEKTENE